MELTGLFRIYLQDQLTVNIILIPQYYDIIKNKVMITKFPKWKKNYKSKNKLLNNMEGKESDNNDRSG